MQTNVDNHKAYETRIKFKFGWTCWGKWSPLELKIIYKTGARIEKYINKITHGNGSDWIKSNFGNLKLVHGNLFGASFALPGIVNLSPGGWFKSIPWYADANPEQHLAHELAHVWDFRVGATKSLLKFMDVDTFWLNPISAYFNYSGKPPLSLIPLDARFANNVKRGYANGAAGDYLAETFGWTIIDPSKLPTHYDKAQIWLKQELQKEITPWA